MSQPPREGNVATTGARARPTDMRRPSLVCLSLLAIACGGEPETRTSEGGSVGGGTQESSVSASSTGGSSEGTTSGDALDTTGETASTTAPDPGPTSSGGEAGSTASSEESGDVLPRGQWAVTEITYTEGGQSETFTMQDRTFCDATLDGGLLQLRYQQRGGYTVWLLGMPEAITVGEHPLTQDFTGVYMNINEVSATWQAYFDPSMALGTLMLTDADIQPGGVVAGTLTATLTSVDGTTTADFESTFYAEIP